MAAAADLASWRGPLSPELTVTNSLGRLTISLAAVIHLTEQVVHGVDLAVAAHREPLLDEHLCAGLQHTMRSMGGIDGYRIPGVFGPEVPSTATALAHERLAAHLGRTLLVRYWSQPPRHRPR